MTNKDKLNRVKEIEMLQVPLIEEIKVLYGHITSEPPISNYQISKEIYYEKTLEMKTLIAEKTEILSELGFIVANGLVDESLRQTELWRQLDSDLINAESAEARYSLCTNCPEFVTISKQCKPLGVFAEEYSTLESSSCPIGKW